ncbi:unnamed protein product [Tenebrio molitor]|nr:unnamed protein product [Tenebrio molitor]
MYSNKTLIGNWFADRGNTLAPTVLAEFPSIVYPEVYNCKAFSEIPMDNEYFANFGNITKYGVVDDKMIEWDLDKKSTRPIYSSVYKHDFKAPRAADYVFKRYVTESHYSHQ